MNNKTVCIFFSSFLIVVCFNTYAKDFEKNYEYLIRNCIEGELSESDKFDCQSIISEMTSDINSTFIELRNRFDLIDSTSSEEISNLREDFIITRLNLQRLQSITERFRKLY